MSCDDEMRSLLSRYVDGELSKEERLKADEHLLGCEPCRELLALFQKNENLLAGALSTEAFGDAVIDSVLRTIKKEPPPEAAPVEEGLGDWLRSRPWIQIAAAALLVVGLILVLNSSHNAEMRKLQSAMKDAQSYSEGVRAEYQKVAADQQATLERNWQLTDEVSGLRQAIAVGRAFGQAKDGGVIGYIEAEHYLVVKGSFSLKSFNAFDLYRKRQSDADDKYVKLNTGEPLQTPEFTDRTAAAGQFYVYKFKAFRPDAEPMESVPIVMRLPFAGDLSPEKSIRIHCEKLAAPKDQAVFVLEKVANGKPVSHRFYVRLGERVRGTATVPGVGEVDFSTEFVLDRIEERTQSRTITYSEPAFDRDGNPILDRIEGGLRFVLLQQREEGIGTRPNMRAILKPASDPKSEVILWKDSWMRVPAR